ncbi:MAG: YicC/YloC family endoribonuclease [Clostridium perfringens]|nr:YicC/YloC family endoribonuclease [Clostridium perfringens]
MVKSMTGFGRGSSDENSDRSFSIEIKSVNHRYLDINVRMPKTLISLEEKMRRLISEKLTRGKVDVFVNFKDYSKSQGIAKVNLDFARSYVKCLDELKEEFKNLEDDIKLSMVVKHPEVIVIEEKEDDLEKLWKDIKVVLESSVDDIISMRLNEGEKLAKDILDKCSKIESLVNFIESKSSIIVENHRIKLKERIKDLLGDVNIDENRLAMEVVIFADKATIDEEIIRLKSHISQLRESLSFKGSIGRKLDFLVQEMNREANTIASKSTDLEITNSVIDIKNIIEKIREQVQNIE